MLVQEAGVGSFATTALHATNQPRSHPTATATLLFLPWQVTAALSDGEPNGIPAFLRRRHADLIERHGAGARSLHHKAFPTARDISKWEVGHAAAGAGHA